MMFRAMPSHSNGGHLNLAVDVFDYDLFAAATEAGFNLAAPVDLTVTVEAHVKIGATSTGNAAFSVAGFVTGSRIQIINQGWIVGKGGKGMPGGQTGGSGGNAVFVNCPNVQMDNQGVIAGGGGGGGGGGVMDSRGGSGPGGGGAGLMGGETIADTWPYTDPESGSLETGGLGGWGGGGSNPYIGRGGKGGDLGQPGQAGFFINDDPDNVPAGGGGMPGAAIVGNVEFLTVGDIRGAQI